MRVSARRAAIVGGLLAAVYVAALFTVRRVPDRLLGIVGGPQGVAREGGMLLRYRLPAGYDTAPLVARAARRGAELGVESGVVVLGVPGVDAAGVPLLAGVVTHGGVELRELVSGSSLTDFGRALPDGAAVIIDQWEGIGTLASRTQAYLRAPDPATLSAAFERVRAAGWVQPPNSVIRYSRASDHTWRSYLLRDDVLLDGSVVEHVARIDAHLAIDVEPASRAHLAERSARLVDHKLVALVDGAVIAELLVRDPIADGRVELFMYDLDVREAAALGTALQVIALPPGGTIERCDAIPAPAIDEFLLRVRLLIGALGGLATGLVIWLVVRITRPVWQPRTPVPRGAFPWRRVAVTLVAPAVMIALGGVEALGFNSGYDEGYRRLGLFELGLVPILVAHVMAELALLASPYWRRRRFDPMTRVMLRRRVAIAALVLALIEGHLYANFAGGRVSSYVALVASLTAGMLVLMLLARLVDRHGLGSGYGVVIVTGWARQVADSSHSVRWLGVITLVAIACVTIATLRMRIRDESGAALRVPSSSLDPMLLAAAILALRPFAHDNLFGAFDGYTAAIAEVNGVGAGGYLLASLLVLVPVWSFALLRPIRAATLGPRAELVQRRGGSAWRGQFHRVTLLSLVVLGLVTAASLAANAAYSFAPLLGDAAVTMISCAVLLDLAADVRGRRGDVVAVWPLHSAQHAELVRGLLGEAGIPCHLQSSHLRTLLATLGAFAPIQVFVPRAAAEAAQARIASLFGDPDAEPS